MMSDGRADLKEAVLEHHAAKELHQVDDGGLQLCLGPGIKLLVQQPRHRRACTQVR